jgi:hypothetical protein
MIRLVLTLALLDVAGGARAGDLIGWQGETHVSTENPDPTSKEGLDSIDPTRFAGAIRARTSHTCCICIPSPSRRLSLSPSSSSASSHQLQLCVPRAYV